ncbi:sugar transferase [Nocardioides sp. TF02-7]|uniref:sugar transferase n=1 Tax=Nocardioides sp. TF02-7 TaxID=2917724 RepID=UPI001F06D5A4|nr:sugar transferase [Nocardioides sp. TF02-7]UMG91528.1 sugar transferase [Nocardioides sp. TF02-7]
MTTPSLTSPVGNDALAVRRRPRAARASRAPRRRLTLRWLRPLAPLVAVGLGLVVLQAWTGGVDPGAAALVAGSWLLLHLACCSGCRPTAVVDASRGVRAALRAGALFGLGCWVLDAVVGLGAPPRALLALTATLAANSALGAVATAAVRRRPVRLVVAGAGPAVSAAIGELERAGGAPTTVVGTHLLDEHPLAALPATAALHDADGVLVLPGPGAGPRDLQRLGWQLAPTRVDLYVDTALRGVAPSRTALTRAGRMRMVRVGSVPSRSAARVAKDAADRLVAALALLALLPLLAALMLAVRRDSPGPALYRQVRIGRDGRPFTMLKLRTMRTAAEEEVDDLAERNEGAGLLFKIRADPRVTRLGGVLRRYSLDELPQLVNIVRGEMSLVGPRPALPQEVAQYDADALRRLAVKPGLTGLWQVSGRSDLDWDESVQLDLAYVDNWSPALDLRIVLRTFGAVLSHRGAY